MADPISLDGMSSDERQELKEAVCDAVLDARGASCPETAPTEPSSSERSRR